MTTPREVEEVRKPIFFVQTMKWDNVYSCYYGALLFRSEKYEECEQFCLKYDGKEETIYIQKAFVCL